jgi:hypothetical protein
MLLLTAIAGVAQDSGEKLRALFENDLVAAYAIELHPRESLANFQGANDTFWIAIDNAAFVATAGSAKKSIDLHIDLHAGEVRFRAPFQANAIENASLTDDRLVMVALKRHGLLASSCSYCQGATAKAVCGCTGAPRLDSLWAVSLGEVTVAGTTLDAGESFLQALQRDDMLLVAISDLDLADEGIAPAEHIQLRAGEVSWLLSGRHKFRNNAKASARFVTLEF